MNLQIIAPNFSETFVRSFIEENYSMKIEKATNLGSYDDQNFLIKTVTAKKYILKIANTREIFGLLSAQNEAMKHLNADETINVEFPEPILSNKNEEIVKLIDEHENIYLVRMLSYLEGTFLGDLNEIPPRLLQDFGKKLALIDKSLLNFENQYLYREMEWDLKNALLVKEFYESIADKKRLNIVKHFILEFEQKVKPILHKLPMQIIHNDANEYNVLSEKNKITAFIDFGDILYSQRINELAIAIAYSFLVNENVLETAKQLLKSYNQIIPLSELEISVLFPLIATRLAVSVSFSAEKQKKEPDNKHILLAEKPAWEALERLIKIDPIYVEKEFREVCGFAL